MPSAILIIAIVVILFIGFSWLGRRNRRSGSVHAPYVPPIGDTGSNIHHHHHHHHSPATPMHHTPVHHSPPPTHH